MANYEQLSAESLNNFKSYINATDFTHQKVEAGISVSIRPFPGSELKMYKAEIAVNGRTPADIASKIWAFLSDANAIKQADDKITEIRNLQSVSPNISIDYQIHSLPWPLWARDMVLMRSHFEEGGVHYVWFSSVTHAGAPEYPDKYVRGRVTLSGYRLSPTATGTQLTRIVHVDPAGSLPTSVVDALASRTVIKAIQVVLAR
eukprot:TRINITY_DN51_c1_g1_i1.p1 TRINITY_DN51_c1_g1~~TRINITY_DN51_c1_g1_i1.p1  ORF type:complete len:203 (-),score=109.04 TRINITY_DN51_c1_g1_i1:87-695(-)